jgi:pyruvate dehydrogenase E2 component (dihydrolipoamide acetyltransferase)
MAHEIVMPQLSLSMDQGQIVRWLKHSGDRINAGDILLEVESDKATIEVEAVESGLLQIVLGPESGDIAVGTVIAYLLAENERQPGTPLRHPPEREQAPASPATAGPTPQAPSPLPTMRRLPSSPAARRVAAELKLDWQRAAGSGRGGRIRERDVLRLAQAMAQKSSAIPAGADAVQLTPLARRTAEHFGLDEDLLAQLAPGKTRFEREDVEAALRQLVRERRSAQYSADSKAADRLAGSEAAEAQPTRHEPIEPGREDRLPRREAMGAVRKRIAERMLVSQHSNAAVTLTTEIDATELVNLRESLKSAPAPAPVPGYNVLMVKIAALALAEYPALNASIEGSEIVYWPAAHIGVAVESERGLVVPVVRDAAVKSIHQLAGEMSDLLERAAHGKASPAELSGGTFTITNLGAFEIDTFTPIINPPECAVLGIGRLRKQMVIHHDQPAVRTLMALSLTFDHRLIDGAPAARFLQRIKQLCETPYLWLR